MTYVDGFVIAVPSGNKEAFTRHAEVTDRVLLELGAIRVLEGWGDDLPEGQLTDFRKAVQARDDETVAFSWIEWPDKETRESGMRRLQELMKSDPRFDPAKNPVPFDGKRMIFGGFAAVVDLSRAVG